jgi:GNAT superfamily N-acetyltransferase
MEHELSKEISSKNLFMMCTEINKFAIRDLPQGFHFRTCRRDELIMWKSMHLDFPHTPEQYAEHMRSMTDYFNALYAKKVDVFFEQCLFVCDKDDMPVGSCFIWKAYDKFSTIHWTKVLKKHEGQGLGRALLTAVMKNLNDNDYPVYLHTHPICFRAIKLYSDFGFRLISNPVVGHRNNDLEECMPVLEKHLQKRDYENLKIVKAPQDFLDAASSTEIKNF